MVACPHCGANNISAEELCWKCGRSLPPAEGKRQPQRECAACGRLIDAEVLICPYCEDDRELKHQLARNPEEPEQQTAADETDATVQLNAQISNAVNIRRIALTLIVATIVSMGSVLVSLMISTELIGHASADDVLKAWTVFALLIMIVGLAYIVSVSRLSMLREPRKKP